MDGISHVPRTHELDDKALRAHHLAALAAEWRFKGKEEQGRLR